MSFSIGGSIASLQTDTGDTSGFGKGLPQHVLGTVLEQPATSGDTTLFWVDSTGVLKGGASYGPSAAPTDIEVKHLKDTGPSEWIYVINNTGAVIQRGTVVKSLSGALPFNITTAGAGDAIVGVAQFDIPDKTACWILKSGEGYALVGAATADLLPLTTVAAGNLSNTGANLGTAVGRMAEAAGAAGIWRVKLY